MVKVVKSDQRILGSNPTEINEEFGKTLSVCILECPHLLS